MELPKIEIFPIPGIPIIREGDNTGEIICQCINNTRIALQEEDIIVIAHAIVSRAEGRLVDLRTVIPSEFAQTISDQCDKDPRHVEVILSQAKSIVRMKDGILIVESKTPAGWVMANAGVDQSNSLGENFALLLPENPDRSAETIRKKIQEEYGVEVAVIITDTFGRALRSAAVNVAIGASGIKPILDLRGVKDLFGYTLTSTCVAIADELASAAELISGQSNEGFPVIVIRGYKYQKGTESALLLARPRENALFW
ncbi:coenzyme F420-0:L-glutamate ligase [Candidatus Borrarchaeum sp.]|uniref:coenzyme F420-0:L-glutamate ligase n=1 Tax=Candidatus Borrarchaeum sp. TaxID=2846742 RepID=UPI0025800980|nr:coenzyme F420-0:L-glutamate ligase [Candidatus Borrarchaeum sp.]